MDSDNEPGSRLTGAVRLTVYRVHPKYHFSALLHRRRYLVSSISVCCHKRTNAHVRCTTMRSNTVERHVRYSLFAVKLF